MNDPSVKTKIVVEPDLERIRKMESAVEEFRLFFETKGVWKKTKMLLRHQFRDFFFVSAPLWRVLWRSRTWQQRMIPTVASTGAVRSGTSAMSNYLLQHPAVVLPLTKELTTALPKLSFIRAQFPLEAEADVVRKKYGVAITADCTPIAPSASAIFWGKAINPNIKLVILVRDPVERVISHWRWNAMLSKLFSADPLWAAQPGFAEAMRIEMRDLTRGGCGFHLFSGAGSSSYLRHSIYLPFIRLATEQFGRDNIKVVNANAFFREPIRHVKEVYEFLGLPDYDPVEIKETNPSPPLDVDDTIRAELKAFFEPFNQELYEFLGQDFGW